MKGIEHFSADGIKEYFLVKGIKQMFILANVHFGQCAFRKMCISLQMGSTNIFPAIYEQFPAINKHFPAIHEHFSAINEHFPAIHEHFSAIIEHFPAIIIHFSALNFSPNFSPNTYNESARKGYGAAAQNWVYKVEGILTEKIS